MEWITPSMVLGVPEGASDAEILEAYSTVLKTIRRSELPADVALARISQARAAFKALTQPECVHEPRIDGGTSFPDSAASAGRTRVIQEGDSRPASMPPAVATGRPPMASAQRIEGEHGFVVDFGGPSNARGLVGQLPFYGEAFVHVSNDFVRIRGRRHRLLRGGVIEEKRFPRSSIRNVAVNCQTVRFEIPVDDGPGTQVVTFSSARAGEANLLARLLPGDMTRAFAKDVAERSSFKERLDAISPSAPITPLLVIVNVAVFLMMWSKGAGFGRVAPEFVLGWGSNFGPAVLDGQWWRLLTGTFLHGGFSHLFFNMLVLFYSGRLAERVYGSARFLLLYLVAGLTGSIATLLWYPVVNSVGASGAVLGVFGGLLAFMGNTNNGVPARVMGEQVIAAMALVGFNLFGGLVSTGVDNAAHAGGLLGGFVMGLLLARPVSKSVRSEPRPVWVAMVAMLALATLGLLSTPLRNPSQSIRQDLAFAAALEKVLGRETKIQADIEALKKRATGTNPHEVARVLEEDIAPQWDAMYRLVDDAKLSAESRQLDKRDALLAYLNAQRKVAQMYAKGIQQGRLQFIQEAQQSSEDAKRQAEALRRLAKR